VIDAVLFDWAGTLTPYHQVDLLGCWAAAAEVIAPDRVAEVAAALFAAEADSWPLQQLSMRSSTTAQLIRMATAAIGIDADEAAQAAALAAYRRAWSTHLDARPDAAAVLTALQDRGLRTGLLSNTHWPRDWHEEALAADGLVDLLDVRLYSSELTHMKPHPIAFQALLDAVGATAERAVFVGDRPHDDISGAKALGLRTVWIRNDHVPAYDVEPDAVIDELAELVDVVDEWNTQAG
jgi:HAD superfamily hydrolase (TIGR01509 family)